ncbi:MAG: helicase HerA domain-containing protein [Neisseriaceae bacterium]
MASIKILKNILSGRMFFDKSFGFSDLLMYGKMVDDGVILQTDGSFLSAFWYCGSDLETSTDEELGVLCTHINNAFNLLGSGWLFHVDTIRHKADGYINPQDCHFEKHLGQVIDEERRQIYYNSGNHYENLYAISFTYKPKIDLGNKISLFFRQDSNGNSIDYSYYLTVFKERLAEVIELLVLNFNIKQMNSSEALSYISCCITGERIKLTTPNNYGTFLKHFLASKDVVGGENPKIGDKYLRVITIMGFPANSYAGILDKLNYLEFEYRFSTRFIMIDQHESNRIIEKIANLWYQKRISAADTVKMSLAIDSNIKINQNAENQYYDTQKARAINDGGDAKFGFYTAVVILYDESNDIVEKNAKLVRSTLRNMGFQSQIERYHSLEAYLGALPGYAYANIRKWLITTQNMADLMPNTSVWSGLNYNPCTLYGANPPPLFYAMTTGNTPLRLSLHVGNNGHTLILGPTGSGKSTLLNFIIAQHFRYKNAQVFMFDKNRSSLPLCYGLNGDFFDIGNNQNSCYFQPLAKLESDEDFEFAATWIEELCMLNGMESYFDDNHRKAIRKGLMLMKDEVVENRRTISYFRYLVQDYDKAVAGILNGFSHESSAQDIFMENMGFVAKLFDANFDKLNELNNNFTVFEMGKLIELGNRIIIPALRYFIYQINKKVTENKPTLIVFDESFIFFKHELFREKIIDWLKTMRKFNVAIIFATQELVDLFKYDDLVSSLKSNCATKMYLPNSKASSAGIKEQYKAMGLNDKQINLISQAILGEYFYISDLGIRKFSLNLDSSQVAYSFTARTNNNDTQEAIRLYALDKDRFVENWCKYTRGQL